MILPNRDLNRVPHQKRCIHEPGDDCTNCSDGCWNCERVTVLEDLCADEDDLNDDGGAGTGDTNPLSDCGGGSGDRNSKTGVSIER